MSPKGKKLEKWLSTFFDQVDAKELTKGQQLFQAGRLFGFEEGASQVEAMVQGTQVYKVTVYYEGTDLLSLGLPNPSHLVCTCTCSEETPICAHSACTILHWALKTEKALSQVVNMGGPGAEKVDRFKTDLSLRRLENAAQSTPGPYDHVLKGYPSNHPLDGMMKQVYKQVRKRIRG